MSDRQRRCSKCGITTWADGVFCTVEGCPLGADNPPRFHYDSPVGRICRLPLWAAIKTEDGQWEAQPPTRANTFASKIPLRVIKTTLSEDEDWTAIGFSGTEGFADRVSASHEHTAVATLLEMWSARDTDPSVIRPGDDVEVMDEDAWKPGRVLRMHPDHSGTVRLPTRALGGVRYGPGAFRLPLNYSRKADET